jgi:hypothetical protein
MGKNEVKEIADSAQGYKNCGEKHQSEKLLHLNYRPTKGDNSRRRLTILGIISMV